MNCVKLIVFNLLALWMLGTAGANQRLLELKPGISCEKIPVLESRLGSIQQTHPVADGSLHYSGTQKGVPATVRYQCSEGQLVEQKITITVPSREEAYRIADEQKAELSRYFGEPVHDGLDMPLWRHFLHGFLGADLDYLTTVVVWGTADQDAMLSVKETKSRQWEICISQGSPKLEYRLNS
ncbi:MAG: hypothetical protein GY703_08850 [Gammaproteobacteria bacterium]|nr:hypothetical protein [Gammaproteobacteria bacterium]